MSLFVSRADICVDPSAEAHLRAQTAEPGGDHFTGMLNRGTLYSASLTEKCLGYPAAGTFASSHPHFPASPPVLSPLSIEASSGVTTQSLTYGNTHPLNQQYHQSHGPIPTGYPSYHQNQGAGSLPGNNGGPPQNIRRLSYRPRPNQRQLNASDQAESISTGPTYVSADNRSRLDPCENCNIVKDVLNLIHRKHTIFEAVHTLFLEEFV
jgi:hypothetical protein